MVKKIVPFLVLVIFLLGVNGFLNAAVKTNNGVKAHDVVEAKPEQAPVKQEAEVAKPVAVKIGSFVIYEYKTKTNSGIVVKQTTPTAYNSAEKEDEGEEADNCCTTECPMPDGRTCFSISCAPIPQECVPPGCDGCEKDDSFIDSSF